MSSGAGATSRPVGILRRSGLATVQGWTPGGEPQRRPDDPEITPAGSDSDDNSSGCSAPSSPGKPKKQVRISELRRGSLTGSLPDLSKAEPAPPRSDQKPCRKLVGDWIVERKPLPSGSTAFQTVRREMSSDSSDSGDDKSSAQRLKGNHGNGKTRQPVRKFRSKAAAVIYAKRFIAPFPKYLEELSNDITHAQASPRREGRDILKAEVSPRKEESPARMRGAQRPQRVSLPATMAPHIGRKISAPAPPIGFAPNEAALTVDTNERVRRVSDIVAPNRGVSSSSTPRSPAIRRSVSVVDPPRGLETGPGRATAAQRPLRGK